MGFLGRVIGGGGGGGSGGGSTGGTVTIGVPSVSLEVTQGDLGTSLAIILGIDVSAVATGAITMDWRKPNGAVSVMAMTNVNLAQGSFKHDWSAGETDVVGIHRGKLIIPTASGNQIYPMDDEYFRWIVHQNAA